jgi:hypothetical protein
MQYRWITHIKDKQAQKSFGELVKGSSLVLDRLKLMLEEKIKEAGKVTLDDYDNTSWPNKQAHLNWYNEAMREVCKLLTIKQTHEG